MPAYKDNKTGKWYCQFYCKNWKGENKHIVKRGFEKRKTHWTMKEILKLLRNTRTSCLKN